MDRSIRVLHIEDDPDFAELVSTYLQREDDHFNVRTSTNPVGCMEILDENNIDCVVSDYDLPRQNGIEFLKAVRQKYPDLPFILYTGQGSEEVASEAISDGVTEYLQKESSTSHYTVLANRIENAVEQSRAKIELADRKQRLDLFIEQSPLGVVRWDDEFNFARLNDTAREILGYNEGELVGQPWANVIPEEAREEIGEVVVNDLLADEGGYHSINENIRKDGERITCEWHNWVVTDEDDEVIAVFSQFEDITERKEQERNLRHERNRFRAVFEKAFDAMVIANDDGQYIDANQHAAELFGLPEEDLIGRSIEEFAPVDSDFEAAWSEFQSSEKEAGTFTLVRPNGMERLVEYAASADIVPGEHLSVLRDITEREERLQALKRQNERLDEFASVVSHDLRNPLNVAEGRLELAQEECVSEHLDAVALAHGRMRALIDDLLALAHGDERPSDVTTVELAELAENCWQNVDTKDATLVINIDRTISADQRRLRHLFENLIRNAIEHGGTNVTVTVGEMEEGFYIEDDGPGIPEDRREDVFEASYSTTQEGTGFGLSIVNQIAEAHDWEIRVTEGTSGGARFEISVSS